MTRIDIDVTTVPEDLYDEANEAAKTAVWRHITECGGQRPVSVKIGLDEEHWMIEFELKPSTISRVRRVTGYLSTLNNFVPSKAVEASERIAHIKLTKETPTPTENIGSGTGNGD